MSSYLRAFCNGVQFHDSWIRFLNNVFHVLNKAEPCVKDNSKEANFVAPWDFFLVYFYIWWTTSDIGILEHDGLGFGGINLNTPFFGPVQHPLSAPVNLTAATSGSISVHHNAMSSANKEMLTFLSIGTGQSLVKKRYSAAEIGPP